MFKFQNRWMDLYEIWYERYAIGDHPKIIFLICVVGNSNVAEAHIL
jgi:hypothetical protein